MDSERYVLSCLLADPSTQRFIPRLSEQCFSPKLQPIFTRIKELYIDSLPIDLVTVANGEGIDKIETAKIQGQYYTSLHFEPHCDLIRAIATKKQIKEDIIKILEKDTQLKTQVNNIQEVLNNAGGIEEKAPEPLAKVTGQLLEDMLEKVKRGEALTGKPSGWAFIDAYLGGWNKGDLVIVAGRPAMGKTAFALGTGLRFAEMGNSVLFLSLEMSNEQLAGRYLQYQEKATNIRRADFNEAELNEMLDWSVRRTEDFWIDDSANLTISDIRYKAQLHRQKYGLDMLVVDYIGLIKSKNSQRNREQEVSQISQQLKLIAKDLGITVIALSQLNRQSEHRADKKPMLSDLRESGSIEQDADCVMFPFRPAYYEEEKPEIEDALIIISKNRHGGTGEFDVRFNPKQTKYL